jgi:hypothetical protein
VGGGRGRGRGSRGGGGRGPRGQGRGDGSVGSVTIGIGSVQFTWGLGDSAIDNQTFGHGTVASIAPGETLEVLGLGIESAAPRGRGIQRGSGRAALRPRKPRNWSAPEILPSSASPPILRQRSGPSKNVQKCPRYGSIHSAADKENACMLWKQYYNFSPYTSPASGRGQPSRRARRGPGPASLPRSPLPLLD